MIKDIEKEELETNEAEEHTKVAVPPVMPKYTRPPAFQQQNSFGRGNQNNNSNKPVIRK
jgi:hypothetical protein